MTTPDNRTDRVAEFALEETTEVPWSVVNLLFAWNGLRAAWRGEAGFRNHVFGAFAMATTLVVIQPDAIW